MTIRIEHRFNAPAQDLWDIVGKPDRVDWVPGVSACAFDGEIRRLVMPGAGEIAERILLCDAQQMRLEYSCIESVPTLDSHLAGIQIQHTSDHTCLMIWETQVEPVAVERFIKQSMDGCIKQIQSLLER